MADEVSAPKKAWQLYPVTKVKLSLCRLGFRLVVYCVLSISNWFIGA